MAAAKEHVVAGDIVPGGLAPRIANYSEWRTHLIARLRRQVEATADETLAGLLRELRETPAPPGVDGGAPEPEAYASVIVPADAETAAVLRALADRA